MREYCLPILGGSRVEVLRTIESELQRYARFEIWLDYITDLDDAFIEHLIALYGERLIVLFRRLQLAPIQLPIERRLAIIDAIAGHRALLDLDLRTQSVELEHTSELTRPLQLIASYHNYESTPSEAELHKLLAQMDRYKPAIKKIATSCNSEDDALRLLSLLLELRRTGQRSIVLGMGRHGLPVRVFGSIWGNALMFAPATHESATAPGQLTRDEYERIFALLGV